MSSKPEKATNNEPSPSVRNQPSFRNLLFGGFGGFSTILGGKRDAASATTNTTPAQGTFSRRDEIAQDLEHIAPAQVEFSDALAQLSNGALADRVAGAEKICEILDAYPLSHISWLWSHVEESLLQRSEPEAVRASEKVFLSIVKLPELEPAARKYLFDIITSNRGDKLAGIQLEVVESLTKNGHDIASFEDRIIPYLTKVLSLSFERANKIRKQIRSHKSPDNDNRLTQAFVITTNILKFQSHLLFDDDVEELALQVFYICKSTTDKRDVEHAIRVIEALITYREIPQGILKNCLEVLCQISDNPNVSEQTRNDAEKDISHLLRAHNRAETTLCFLEILKGNLTEPRKRLTVNHAAVKILTKFMFGPKTSEVPEFSILEVISTLEQLVDRVQLRRREDLQTERSAIAQKHQVDENDLDLVDSLQLRGIPDWFSLANIIATCASEAPDKECRARFSEEAWDSIKNKLPYASSTDPEAHPLTEPVFRVLCAMYGMREDLGPLQEDANMQLLVGLGKKLPDILAEGVIQTHVEQLRLSRITPHWPGRIQDLLYAFFRDKTRSLHVRLHAFRAVSTVVANQAQVVSDPAITKATVNIIDLIKGEKEAAILSELTDFAVEIASSEADPSTRDELKDHVLSTFRRYFKDYIKSLPVRDDYSTFTTATAEWPSPSNIITKALVRIFIKNYRHSVKLTLEVFEFLLDIARQQDCDSDARLAALRLLTRLRCDANYSLRVNPFAEGGSMAPVLFRTADTVKNALQQTGDLQPSVNFDGPATTLARRDVSGGTRSLSSSARHVPKVVDPLWLYPTTEELPEEVPEDPSRLFCTYKEPDSDDERTVFPAGKWLELAIHLFQRTQDWEVRSYILVHLGPQLCNHSLFRSAVPTVRLLRSVLSDQVRNLTYWEPPDYTALKRGDVAVCIFHILTMIVSYHANLEKSEQDDMVKTFLLGIGAYDKTSKWCIHALTVCCHELPDSTTKHLQNIVQKMSQIITQPYIAMHILEFLTHIVRMPHLFVNFRDEQFKMVFGVCFRYLQSVRDQQARANNAAGNRLSQGLPRGPPRDSDQSIRVQGRYSTDDLPQYVYALAYHVITFWFMAMKLEERKKFISFIQQRLSHTDEHGKTTYEEQALITIDMLHSRAYTDRDETAYKKNFAAGPDGEVVTKSWILGENDLLTLLTFETAVRTGLTQMAKRRFSFTSYGIYAPTLASPPLHQVPLLTGLAADEFYKSTYVGVLPDDIFQGMYLPLVTPANLVELPDDDATRRAIAAIDRSSTVDGHKVGVLYIAQDQETEREVLENVFGSTDYNRFLESLGTLVKLEGANMNTQGLDREFNSDGTHTICWRDRAVEIIFHITTMMPTDLEFDPQCINKKKHIGNDYVNIIFNDSGRPFDFNMFPSAFNYVYIVIAPEVRPAFFDYWNENSTEQFYKVQLVRRPGFPEISPASETKIISGKGLAAYVRMLALNASVFCQVWSSREAGEYVSPWRNRLREIQRLAQRHRPQQFPPTPPSTGVEGRGGSSLFHRQSNATFISDGNRSSIMSSSTEMERQGSNGSRG
ncbi:hypothetical protein K490DRAFT_45675 [Saccharata proteae CBS 121410]|uniref:Rap-GAP domain-containing protein n=1 Tax=Saccharata proteae CBS 121410 TaxID=1314787 RepID=A0A9P4HV14_9PEZI|nr:hypothetical protein K490DRAFT_45675 [Saccharata proteae CBS 121410]